MKTNCDHLESAIKSISRIAVNAAEKAKSGLPLDEAVAMRKLEKTLWELKRQLLLVHFDVEDIDNPKLGQTND